MNDKMYAIETVTVGFYQIQNKSLPALKFNER